MIGFAGSRTAWLSKGAAGVVLAMVLGACGTKAASTTQSPAASPSPSASTAGGAGGNGGRPTAPPGASGSVAAISGSSMEVQNPTSGQTTVNWTTSTVFSHTVTVTASALTPGTCVTVTGDDSTPGTFSATTVVISQLPVSGSCTGTATVTGGGPGRFFNSATPFPRRTPSPGSSPRAGRRFAGGGGFATGKVTSLSGSTLVVTGISSAALGAAGAGATTAPSPAPVSITLTPSTTYTETETTSASSLAVGDCVAAQGPQDDTGAITANTVRITSTGGQTCTGAGAFGGGFFFRGGAGGAGGAAGGSGGGDVQVPTNG